jgi:formimidoylglutamate deiminase
LADFFTVDLNDASIAGNSGADLLPLAVFSLNRSAIRDVMINGRWVVRDQRHPLQEEIVSRYKELHRKLWGSNVGRVS